MTTPPGMRGKIGRVTDMVRDMFPRLRSSFTPDERDVAAFLRGNDALMKGLRGMFMARIGGRAKLPVPSDPLQCKSMLERDDELRRLLGRLEFLHSSADDQSADTDGEQPAA